MPSVVTRIEGGLLDAICAEPAIEAFCRQTPSVAITVASAHADVYVGHPGVSGILYLEADTHPDGFDRIITVPAAPSETPIAERIARAAESLGVQNARLRPHIHLTGLDILRTERLIPGRTDQPTVALCLNETDANLDRRRWETMCRLLEERWNAAIVLLSGPSGALRAHKNLAGRLMPRETAAVLTRCAAWLGNDPICAALALAVDVPGVWVSDTAVFRPDEMICLCPTDASDQQLFDAINRVQRPNKTIKQP